jgi:hypothetical protein
LARLCAKAIFLTIVLALVFFGVGFLALAIATAFVTLAGYAWGNAIAGAILLLPPLIWAFVVWLSGPARPQTSSANGVLRALFGAVARETPWVAVLGAGLAGAAEMFLNRNKPRR